MKPASTAPRTPLYYRLWRWHFFAGLFCVPFVLILSITGSIYLFKPQINHLLEARYHGLADVGSPLPPDAIVTAAQQAVTGSSATHYTLPETANEAVKVSLATPDGAMTAYVHPSSGDVLGTQLEADTLMETVRTIHGELLTGDFGSLIVELVASWTIVMLATGLFLWWPRGQGLAGVVVVRTGQGKRLFWRDLHAVTGIWVSGAALVLIVTGLPWTNVWGDGFKWVRDVTGTSAIQQDWSQSRDDKQSTTKPASTGHEGHGDHAGHSVPPDGSGGNAMPHASWAVVVAQAQALNFVAPVKIAAPTARKQVFVVSSDTANRPLRAKAELSVISGNVLGVEQFSDRHVIDQAVGVGIALHEGALFGLANQILGFLTALGLMVLSVSSLMMWWARRPKGALAAPPFPAGHKLGPGIVALAIGLGLFLPVLGACIVAIAVLDRIVWPVAQKVVRRVVKPA